MSEVLNSIIDKLQNLFMRVIDTEILRRIVKNSSYLVSATGIIAVLGTIQAGFVTRLIGVSMFGLLGAIRNFSNIVNRFTSFRINEMVVRNVRHYEEQSEHGKAAAVYKLAGLLEMIGAAVAFALIWALAPWGAGFFGKDAATANLWVLYGVVVLVNMLYESSSGLLQVFDHFRSMAVINVLQSATTLVLVIIASINSGGLYEILWIYVIGKTIGAVGVLGVAFDAGRKNWGKGWWRTKISVLADKKRELLQFAINTNLSSTISIIAKDSEILWVSAFLGNEAAGYYTYALYFINIMKLPINPLPKTIYPELTREFALRNWNVARNILKRGSVLAATYSLPVAAAFVLLGRPMIEIVSGIAYSPVYKILMVLLVGYTFDNIFFWNRVALLALNRPAFPTMVNFTGMLIKIIGIFMLFDVFGRVTFAYMLSGYYIFSVGFAAWRVWTDLNNKIAVQTQT